MSARLSGLAIQQTAGGFTTDVSVLTLSGALQLTDERGGHYASPAAAISATGAHVVLGPDRKPREIDAAGLDIRGQFTATAQGANISGEATLTTGAAKIVMGPDGTPTSVTAAKIAASGDIVAKLPPGPAKTPDENAQALDHAAPIVREAATAVRSAQIHTHTPMLPGRYGRFWNIKVPAGAMLNLNVEIADNALTGNTNVTIAPPLDLPAWFTASGVDLQIKGSQALVHADLHGFLGPTLSALGTKLASPKLPLDLGKLVGFVLPKLRDSIAHAKPPDHQKEATDAGWLAREHADWASDTAGHMDPKQRAEDAMTEPRGAEMADVVGKGIDAMATTGTADVHLVKHDQDGDVDASLHGVSQGGGKLALSADHVDAGVAGNTIAVGGVDTGTVAVSGGGGTEHVKFTSFSIESLHWLGGK
jgi:hypothetical protein